MAQHLVFTCDWCSDDVPAKPAQTPTVGNFAAHLRVTTPVSYASTDERRFDICAQCKTALDALTQGKYRRGGA